MVPAPAPAPANTDPRDPAGALVQQLAAITTGRDPERRLERIAQVVHEFMALAPAGLDTDEAEDEVAADAYRGYRTRVAVLLARLAARGEPAPHEEAGDEDPGEAGAPDACRDPYAGDDDTHLYDTPLYDTPLCDPELAAALFRTCITPLPRLGPAGRALLARLLDRTRHDVSVYIEAVTSIPDWLRMAVYDHFLASPWRFNAAFRRHALDGLTSMRDADARELADAGLHYLRHRVFCWPPPAFAVRESLAEGPTGRMLEATLAQSDDATRVEETALVSTPLVRQAYAEAICARLAEVGGGGGDPAFLLMLLQALIMHRPRATNAITRPLMDLLRSPSSEVRKMGLEALTAVGLPTIGKLASLLFFKKASRSSTGDGSMRSPVIATLPLLPESQWLTFWKSVPKGERPALAAWVLLAMGRIDPALAADCVDKAARMTARLAPNPVPHKQLDLLHAMAPAPVRPTLLQGQDRHEDFGCTCGAERPDSSEYAEEGGPVSFDLRMDKGNGHGNSTFGSLFGTSSDTDTTRASSPKTTQAPTNDTGTPFVRDGERLTRYNLAGQTVTSSRLAGCQLDRPDFCGATFEQTEFMGTWLAEGRLCGATFSDCYFTACTFDGCDLTGARFVRCHFDDVVFAHCALGHVEIAESSLRSLALDESALNGARLITSSIHTARFCGLDLSRALFDHLQVNGAEFLDCTVHAAELRDSRMINLTMEACSFSGCMVRGLKTNHPTLIRLMADSRRHLVAETMEMLTHTKPPAGLTREGQACAMRAVDLWFRYAEAARRESPFLRNNARRIGWGMEKMGREQSGVYRMIPLLLHTDFFEQEMDVASPVPVPRLTISGYEPDYTALELARMHFAHAALPQEEDRLIPTNPPRTRVTVEALYTIGSLGTVAQSDDSDIDYWVCCRLDELTPEQVRGIQAKLDAITAWAEQAFGMEVYFFLMDERAVRENNFGFSDKESSGSAQALMLKEEFYRTAVHVAGRQPVWWLALPGADQSGYDATVSRYIEPLGSHRFIDLGHVWQIPPQEFFGASLWQIVKALKSPFKSVMKFGLLEKYTATSERGSLLCDRMKHNILNNANELWNIDPYVVLFLEVANYYAGQGEAETVELVKTSFFLKAQMHREAASVSVPGRAEERSIRELFSRYVAAGNDSRGRSCFAESCAAGQMDLSTRLQVARRVNDFIISGYAKVSKRLQHTANSSITPQDLTKLGRKIFSVFAKKPHKVDRLPFSVVRAEDMERLSFVAQKKGRTSEYVVTATQSPGPTQAGKRMEEVELKRAGDLCRLCCWLAAGHLYQPGATRVQVDFSLSPVIARDVQDLLARIGECFPPKATFDTDISQMLAAEHVNRVLLISNFMLPRETPQIRQLHVIYSTNWGEMFCRPVDVTSQDEVLSTDLLVYLLEHVDADFSEQTTLSSFTPSRAACPPLNV